MQHQNSTDQPKISATRSISNTSTCQVPDQRLATLFYVAGLGLTRDPYLMVSDSNMWVNVGRSQFHLPSGRAAGAARPYRHRDIRP